MAVEKMVMLNVVGKLDNLEEILFEVLKTESVDMVDAISQLNKSNAIYELDIDDVDMIVDVSNLVPFTPNEEERELYNKTQKMMDYYGIDALSLKDLENSNKTREDIHTLYEETKTFIEEENSIREKIEIDEKFKENMSLFKNVDISISELRDMKYFTARFGRLEKSARLRLKQNYNHIVAAVFHTGSYENEEVYLAIYPNEVAQEADRILQSLHWIDVPILEQAQGTAKETIARINEEEGHLGHRLKELEKIKEEKYKSRTDEIRQILAKGLFYGRIEDAKVNMAKSKKYFLLSGWCGESEIEKMKGKLNGFDHLSITAVDGEGENLLAIPPTKLKNHGFFRPFELLVRMYGVPEYNEIDPTIFVGITYMILFGAMFGDLGQGAVFAIVGFLLARKQKYEEMGGLLTRLGLSSMVFGLLYGSFFGSEEVIPALWMRPFENINDALVFAIAFGVVLLLFAYGLSFYNAFKNKNLYEGIFGEHGLMGFLVFAMLIVMLLDITGIIVLLPVPIAAGIMILAILLMIFRKPIMAKIERKDVEYEGGKAGYYIESSFSIIELLISTLSGIVSFIRVGAFAINHVGLFMAFQTMAKMVDSGFANILILVIGNILIIGLEGLIVFIQGLRLEYYELFSRYYSGSGTEFKSDTLKLKKKK